MNIYIATDHAGFTLKEFLKEKLSEKGYSVKDCGAFVLDKNDDYPDFISKVAEQVGKDPEALGIVIGGSGQGEAITANKYKGVRCALFYAKALPAQTIDIAGKESTDPFEILKLTRQHNQANMLSLAARFLSQEDALQAVQIFLETPVSTEERHIRRIGKIKEIEHHA